MEGKEVGIAADRGLDILRISREKGVFLELNDGGLSLKSEKGEIDSVLLGIIRENKQDIIRHLEKLKKNGQKRDIDRISEKVIAYDKTGMTHIPLSYSQERLWFIDKIQGSVQYHIPMTLEFKGGLDTDVLEKTFRTIITRHSILRTVIKEEEGVGYQELLDPDNWKLEYDEGKMLDVLRLKVSEFISTPFNLAEDYMVKGCLYEKGSGEYLLAIVFHHISSDGWSNDIVMREFTEVYEAYRRKAAPNLPGLPLQYQDYAIWQRKYITGEFLENQLNYWDSKLSGVPALELPTDFNRPAVQSVAGSSYSFKLERELAHQLNMICKKEGVTLYMLLLSAFKVLLYRYTGQEDICVGSPIAGRTQAELEGVVGFFVNTLALRTNLGGNPAFIDVLNQVKTTTLEAYEHQQVPFEKIVERVVKNRDMGRSPLFQAMFTLQNSGSKDQSAATPDDEDLSGFEYETQTAKFDLHLTAVESSQTIYCGINYSTDIFGRKRIQQMAAHYSTLLKSIVKDLCQPVGRLSMLQPSEEKQLLYEFNDTAADYPREKTVTDLFRQQVTATPLNTAVVYEGESYSYRQLDEASDQLAAYLQALGVTAETLVPICMERSIDSIIGILGILKAGGAYVPIGPDYPQERISFIIEDTAATMVLSTGAALDKLSFLPGAVQLIDIGTGKIPVTDSSVAKNASANSSSNLMYVIYTSGSTGKPKGVMIEHVSALNTILSQITESAVKETDRCLQFINTTFDVSVSEIFTALLSGASLYIIKEELKYDIDYFINFVKDNQISIANLPPAFFGILPVNRLSGIRTITTAGEQAVFEPSKLFAENGRFINAYGPTECSIYATAFAGSIEDKIPIGRPILNTQIYILDKEDNLSPLGAAGELCIGGAGLARGYLNRAELTREKFVPNLFRPGERMYRTGDLARWLPDGNIEFLGRKDDQVKIRGYRIELGEIENALAGLDGIKSCCVLARPDAEGSKRLIGYVVQEGGLDKSLIESGLRAVLPDYMVPRLWVSLDVMPLNSNGKIDRKALPNPDMSSLSGKAYVAPRTAEEAALADIWMELLKVERVGVNDNFFELGGHSLMATRLVSVVATRMNKSIAVRSLLEYPVLADLAQKIAAEPAKSHKETGHLVKMQNSATGDPVFILPGTYGFSDGYFELAKALGTDYPVFGINMYGYNGNEQPLTTVEEIAALNIRWIKDSIKRPGHYNLIGHSLGGLVACEMMRQLQLKEDIEESSLILLDTPVALDPPKMRDIDICGTAISLLLKNDLKYHTFSAAELNNLKYELENELATKKGPVDFAYLKSFMKANGIYFDLLDEENAGNIFNLIKANIQLTYKAVTDIRCKKTLFTAEVSHFQGIAAGWNKHLSGLMVKETGGSHHSMVTGDNAIQLAKKIKDVLI